MKPSEAELADAVIDALRPLVGQLVREEIGRALSTKPAIEWLTVEEYAARRRTTVAAVHQRLRRGKVEGALKEGRRWLIPIMPPAVTLNSPTGHMARAA
jgi:hypothetical protein